MRIDAHQHFWQPLRGDYDWMPPDDPILARLYDPSDLAPLLARHGIDATVLVQAAPTVNETEYLLGIADATPFVAGVVGWVDFGSPQPMRRLAQHPKFLGLRPMIQDIPDTDWMLRDEVQPGFRLLCDLGLTFDALGFPRHLPNFLTLLKRYPALRCVVDHAMKPQIREPGGFAAWAEGMSRIADETGAHCKLSGLITEAAANWTVEDVKPYADHILRAFGPERVMWGSDWPVCRLRASYGEWFAVAHALTEQAGTESRDALFGETAARFYDLRVSPR